MIHYSLVSHSPAVESTTTTSNNNVPEGVGVVMERYPALLLTDANCFPGMEGGGVFDRNGRLIGVSKQLIIQFDSWD